MCSAASNADVHCSLCKQSRPIVASFPGPFTHFSMLPWDEARPIGGASMLAIRDKYTLMCNATCVAYSVLYNVYVPMIMLIRYSVLTINAV